MTGTTSGQLDCQDVLTHAGHMLSLQELEHHWTLTAAVARYEQLRARDSLATPTPSRASR